MKGKISIGTSAFAIGVYKSNPIPLKKVLSKLQELNFQGIELFGAKPYCHPDDYPTKADRKKLLKDISQMDLEISNYGGEFENHSILYNDRSEIELYKKIFERNLYFCVDCEIQSMRVDTVDEPPLPEGVKYEDAWNRIVETWQECSENAKKEDVLLVWEFEPGFMFNKPHEVVKLVKEINNENFKVMFDTCHAHMSSVVGARQEEPLDILSEGVVELAQLLKEKIGYVHLIDSDNTLHDNCTSTHAPFGSGVIDFHKTIEAITDSGYEGPWWTIDLCFWPKAWEIVEESKNFVKKLLKEHGIL